MLVMANIEKIKGICKERGLSQSYIASKCGRSGSYLSQTKAKGRGITTDELRIIARELNVSEDYLLDKTEDPSRGREDASAKKMAEIMSQMDDEQIAALLSIANQMIKK